MNLQRVAALLASGLKQVQVATIVGCSPARISQVIATPEFQMLLADAEVEIEKADVEEVALSAKYMAVEHNLIDRIVDLAPMAEMRDITMALRVVAERQEKVKQRQAPVTPATVINQTVVSLSLPSHAVAIPEMTRSKQNEITAIGGETIAPLSSTAVTNLFASLKEAHHEQVSSNTSSEESIAKAIGQEELVA